MLAFATDIPMPYHRELKELRNAVLDRSISVIRELIKNFKGLGQPRTCYADDPEPDQGFHLVWKNFTIHVFENADLDDDPSNVYGVQFFPNVFRPDSYEVFSYPTPRKVLEKAAEIVSQKPI